jgi:hypothetical protein
MTEHESFYFSNGRAALTPDDLTRLCEEFPHEAIQHLTQGHFELWFKSIGRQDLAQVAVEACSSGGDDNERLSLFVGFSKVLNYFKRARERRFTFLLVGRTGVGKSSTINVLLGKKVAEVGDTEPVTADVVAYETEVQGVPCLVVDTPGLCDGKKRNKDYIARMHRVIGNQGVDCFWFVTPLYETRVRTDEIKAINLITRAFGVDVWRRSVVVLTFADYLPRSEQYTDRLGKRPILLREAIANSSDSRNSRMVGQEVAQAVPFIPVTNERETTPDGRHWLGPLYLATLDRMSTDGFGAFFSATATRIVTKANRKRRDIRRGSGATLDHTPIPTSSKSPGSTSLSSETTHSASLVLGHKNDYPAQDIKPPSQFALTQAHITQINVSQTNIGQQINIEGAQEVTLQKIVERKVERATGFRSALGRVAEGATELGRGLIEVGRSLGRGVSAIKNAIGLLSSVIS